MGFEVEDCDAMGVSVDYFWQVRQVAILSSVGVGRFRFYVPFVAAWREAGELVGDGEVSGVSVLYFEVFARNSTASFDWWRLAVPDATSQIRALADDSAMSIADFILRR